MLQVGFVTSYYTESVFIELITGKLIRSGMSQNGRKQYIQAGHLAENKTFGSHFPRLEQCNRIGKMCGTVRNIPAELCRFGLIAESKVE